MNPTMNQTLKITLKPIRPDGDRDLPEDFREISLEMSASGGLSSLANEAESDAVRKKDRIEEERRAAAERGARREAAGLD
ncbi:MAG: hypothetical protein ABL994_20620 [Verrucomicrobiales bacterium]